MDNSFVIEKVKKLLILSRNHAASPHEAANAAAAAEKLIVQHAISQSSIQTRPNVPFSIGVYFRPIYSSMRRTAWKCKLAAFLGRHYSCKVVMETSYDERRHAVLNYNLTGTMEDCETACVLFDWLEGEITHLTKTNAAGRGYTFSQSYAMGVCDGVCERITKAREEAYRGAPMTALTIRSRKDDEVNAKFLEIYGDNLEHGRRSLGNGPDHHAHSLGVNVGKTISIRR